MSEGRGEGQMGVGGLNTDQSRDVWEIEDSREVKGRLGLVVHGGSLMVSDQWGSNGCLWGAGSEDCSVSGWV